MGFKSQTKMLSRQIGIYLTISCLIFNFHIGTALAGPSGHDVQYGNVTVHYNGNNTIVNITSNKAIINWASLNTLPNEVLQFLQQSSNSAVLNRIMSGTATQFNGTLLANGRVFIVNPAGVYFGNGAKINVNQLVASSLNISNADFINGQYNFSGGTGSVINSGDITAEKVYLIGKQVANYGNISCPGGYVVMASGDRVFLGEVGSDVVVEIDVPSLPQPAGHIEGSAILNEGTIEVGDGAIILAAAGDIYSQAISNIGTLSASSDIGDAGQVKLTAPDGTIVNEGTVEATGQNGGQVAVEGARVGQFGTIHADGTQSDGGKVDLWASDIVALSPDSLTTANAGLNGDGGDVTVFSPEAALFWPNARIEAKGGSESGNGGFVEMSGREYLLFKGNVDASSFMGENGTLLIDPATLQVIIAGAGVPTWADHLDGFYYDNTDQTKLAPADIITELGFQNVLLLATNSITITDTLNYNQSNDLKLQTTAGAGNAIIVNASITNAGSGDLIFNSGTGDVDLNAAISIAGGTFTSTGVNFDNSGGGTIGTGGGSLTINHTGNVTVGSALSSGAGSVDIDASGAGATIALNSTINTTTGNVTIDSTGVTTVASAGHITTTTGTVTFGAIRAGTLTTSGDIDTSDAAVTFTNAVTLGGNVDIDTTGTAAGNILFSSTIATAGKNLTLDAGPAGNITLSGALTGGGDMTVRDGAIQSYQGLTVNSLNILDATTSVTFGGNIGATTTIDVDSGGTILQTGKITSGTNLDYDAGSTIGINDTIGVSGTVDIDSTGVTTIGTNGDITAGGAVKFGVAKVGTLTTSGDIDTTDDDVTFTRAVTLGGNVDIDTTGTAAGNILFSSTIATAGKNLALDAGPAGNITLSGALTGGGDMTVRDGAVQSYQAMTLNSLNIQDATTSVTLGGALAATTTIDIDSQGGSIVQNGAVTSATTLDYDAGTTIAVSAGISGVSGTVDIDSTGTTTIAAAGDITAGGAVTFGAAKTGTLTTSGDVDTTDDDITFTRAVTLGGNVDIDTTGAAAGNILFSSTIATAGKNLTLDAGPAGNITLSGALTGGGDMTVRDGAIQSYQGLTVNLLDILDATTSVTFGGNIGATTTIDVVSGGTIVQNGKITGGTNLDYDAGSTIGINDSITVSGTVDIDSTGTTTIAAAGDITAGGAVTFGAAKTGTLTTSGDVDTTNDNVTFTRAVTLGGNVDIDTGVGAGDILFSDTLDGTTALTEDLTLTAGTGDITFAGIVGGVTPLGTVTVNSADNVYIRAAFNVNNYVLRGAAMGSAPVALPTIESFENLLIELKAIAKEVVGVDMEAPLQWLAEELGEEAVQIYLEDASDSLYATDLRPYKVAAKLMNLAAILKDADNTRRLALAAVVGEFVKKPPPSEEQMASIKAALLQHRGDGTRYDKAREWLDALAAYVDILNTEIGWSSERSIEFVMGKYGSELDTTTAMFVQMYLQSLGSEK